MTIFSSPLILAASIALIFLHVVPRLTRGIVSKIIEIVNITLHIVLICGMLFARIPYEEVVLVLMLSLFVYVVLYCVFSKIGAREGGDKYDV